MLPDRCTSIHSQEEPTENRDKTNESNINVRLFIHISIQCIHILTTSTLINIYCMPISYPRGLCSAPNPLNYSRK